MARLRALAGAGLPVESVATVLRLDFGDDTCAKTVKRAIETGRVPRPWRALDRKQAAA